MYSAISAMYKCPRARVILNNVSTNWFSCSSGVKQGDTISPTLFSVFVNDLIEELNSSGSGISLEENFSLACLAYADDIVLLAPNENSLQVLINIVYKWCTNWRMEANLTKTNIMHVRRPRFRQTNFVFKFGAKTVDFCSSYKYLGVTLNEYLNFEYTAQELADPAGRALGSIVTKMIKNGGFPAIVYRTLYECCVCSISDYASEVWGNHEYDSTKKLHNRAIRSFLGVPKGTPIPGLLLEMNWPDPRSRTQIRMVRQYQRIQKMDSNRLTKKILEWDIRINTDKSITTWSSDVRSIFVRNNLQDTYSNIQSQNIRDVIQLLLDSLTKKTQIKVANESMHMSKLRTYNHCPLFKESH